MLSTVKRACRWLADGVAAAGTDLELQRQLGFLYQRCATPPRTVASGDTAAVSKANQRPADSAAARVADSLPQRAPTKAAKYRVQVAAVATPGAADDAATKAEQLGFPAVIVRERGYYKVRAGTFATKQEAQAAAAKLKSGMGGSPFVVAEP